MNCVFHLNLPTSCDDLISATLKLRQYSPSLLQITAFLLNIMVAARCFGLANFANIIPAITHLKCFYYV